MKVVISLLILFSVVLRHAEGNPSSLGSINSFEHPEEVLSSLSLPPGYHLLDSASHGGHHPSYHKQSVRVTQEGSSSTSLEVTMNSCERDKDLYHISTLVEYSCDCLQAVDVNQNVIAILVCIDLCGQYCNDSTLTKCGTKSHTQFYDITTGLMNGYADGFIPSVTSTEVGSTPEDGSIGAPLSLALTDCASTADAADVGVAGDDNENNLTCNGCGLSVGTDLCQSCEMITCGDGTTTAPFVDCENIQINSLFDFCPEQQIVIADGDQFEYFATNRYEQCYRDPPVEEYCQQVLKPFYEDDTSGAKRSCTCVETREFGYSLNCIDECWYCNIDQTNCIAKEIRVMLDKYGQQIESQTLHKYVKLADNISDAYYDVEATVVEYSILSELDENGNSCRLSVNGNACAICQVSTCVHELDSGFFADGLDYIGTQANCDNLIVDGTLSANVEPTSIIDLCSLDVDNPKTTILETSIFQVLLAPYSNCLDPILDENDVPGTDESDPNGDGPPNDPQPSDADVPDGNDSGNFMSYYGSGVFVSLATLIIGMVFFV